MNTDEAYKDWNSFYMRDESEFVGSGKADRLRVKNYLDHSFKEFQA